MLSDEEKKAIDTILNLIEKQQKEIEELKDGQIDFWISDKEIEERIRNKFVSKDKIKAIIEELDEEIKVKKEIAKNPMDRVSGRLLTDNMVELEKTKKVLQSLLEERN